MPLTPIETSNLQAALRHTNGVMPIRVFVNDLLAGAELLKGKHGAKAIKLERPAGARVEIPPPVVE